MTNRSSHPSKHGDDSRLLQRPQAESRNQRPPKSQHASSAHHQAAATKKAAKDALQEWDDDIAHLVESSIVTPRTVRASLVLVLAMAVALLYNHWEGRDVDQATSTFLQAFCQAPDAACHPRVGPRRRSQQAIASVPRGDTIVTVPRRLMILDVDALQDPYLRDNWAGRMVRGSASTMDAAAYLAVYLSRLLQARKREAANRTDAADDNDDGTSSSSSKAALPTPSSNSLLARYLDVLASANVENHPLALNDSFVERHLAGTSSLDVWRKHRLTIASEYERLADASPGFARSTSYEEYRTARLLVLTRAFGTGPPPSSTAHRNMQSTVEAHSGHGEPDPRHEDSSANNLLRTLEAQYNVDLSMGSYAMVPVLDFYDHHASPNVGFEFKFRGRHGHDDDSSDRRRHHHDENDQQHMLYADGYFHITALQTITPEATLYDSYGMRTDSDLFARYGFLQGDGTDCTQASLALHPLDFRPFHRRPADFLVKQRGLLLRYLQYDDGYLECVNPAKDKDAGNAYELKRLKYLYLLRRADSLPSWTVVMHPRTVAGPPKDRDGRPKAGSPPYNPVQHPPVANGTSAYTTCRVISLLDTDYENRAVELLAALANDTSRHSLPPLRRNNGGGGGGGGDTWEDALEYRTLHCMTRLISASMQRLNTTLDDQMDALRRHPENQQTPTPAWSWHFAQLKLGEVATLMHLREIVHGHLRNKYERFFQLGNVPGYAIHRNGCPRERLDPLFELYGTGPL
jgi:hypothetical protein